MGPSRSGVPPKIILSLWLPEPQQFPLGLWLAQAPAFQDCGFSRGQSPLSLVSVCLSLIGLTISVVLGKPSRGPLRRLPLPGSVPSGVVRCPPPPWQGRLHALEVRRVTLVNLRIWSPPSLILSLPRSHLPSAAPGVGGALRRPSSRVHLDWLSSRLPAGYWSDHAAK